MTREGSRSGKRMVWVVSLSLLLLASPVRARLDRQVCEQRQPTASPESEPQRPVVPDTFEVHVDCKIANANRSTEVHEYYDYANNRGVMHQIEYGSPYYLYYDYAQNEALTVFPKEKRCFVEQLSGDVNRFLFGYKTANGRGHVFSPSAALHVGFSGATTTYLGSGWARGVRVHTWYSCQYVPEFDASVNVYWSFTDPRSWDTAVGYPDTPVQCRVAGVAINQNDPMNGTHTFSHTYDFLHFKNFISRREVFETPDDVVCAGRVNSRTVPDLPDAFSFTVEVVNVLDKQVSFMQEWYDYRLNVVQFRYVPGPYQSILYGGRPLREVHDFGTGVAYIMDEKLGNCTVTSIERDVFDDRAAADVTHVRLRTAVEFFDLDNTKSVYMGPRTVRGLPCETWIANKADYPHGSNNTATLEWSFRADNWTSTLDQQALLSGGTPVQMHLELAGEEYDNNFFHFFKSRPDVLAFDVSPCFLHRGRRNFDFAISNDFLANVKRNLREFKLSVLASLVYVTELSALRIADIQVVFLDNIHIRVSLLDKAPISGDVSKVQAQPELANSANALLQVIRNNSFIIGGFGPDGQTSVTKMVVLPDSVREYVHESDLTLTSTTPSVTTTTPTAVSKTSPTPSASKLPPGVSQTTPPGQKSTPSAQGSTPTPISSRTTSTESGTTPDSASRDCLQLTVLAETVFS
ncbi:uncharacterized protein [Littorina saxatilis]|uniref:uncharacterized protein n=1 Tax=Littorina saxatilis TaxID=31220 RepID=UPI0038B46E6C